MDNDQIDSLKQWFTNTGSYDIKENGEIDVNGTLTLNENHPQADRIPFQFGSISGDFIIKSPRIKSLAGCPRHANRVVIKDMAGFDAREIKEILEKELAGFYEEEALSPEEKQRRAEMEELRRYKEEEARKRDEDAKSAKDKRYIEYPNPSVDPIRS